MGKRTVIVPNKKAETLFDIEFMIENNYSCQVYPLSEETSYSGPGDSRGYVCIAYYAPMDEQTVVRAFNGLGITITDSEREAVDPDTSIDYEKVFVSSTEQVCNFSMYEWEVLKEGQAPQEYKDGK